MKPAAFQKVMKSVAGELAAPKELLDTIGLIGQGASQRRSRVDTGTMRRSLTYRIEGNAVWIGTPVEYAVFWEDTKYKNADPFIGPAIQDSVPEIERRAGEYGFKLLEKVGKG